MHGSLRQLQVASSSLETLEKVSHQKSPVPAAMLAGFDLLTLNVEHNVKTKVVAFRQLLHWVQYRAGFVLEKTGALPPRFVFHCLY